MGERENSLLTARGIRHFSCLRVILYPHTQEKNLLQNSNNKNQTLTCISKPFFLRTGKYRPREGMTEITQLANGRKITRAQFLGS